MTAPRLHDSIRLVAIPSAIGCSRVFVAYTLDKWDADVIVDDAVLVVDELVTNAVTATSVREERAQWTEVTRIEFITVRLLGLDASIRIEVWGSAPHLPAIPPVEAGGHIKRGTYPLARGKVVWAELLVLSRRSEPGVSIQLPLSEELGRQQSEADILRRVREGLEGL